MVLPEKLLTINLSTTVRSVKDIDETVARNYLGAAGLGAHMLSSMDWSLDAFHPDNRLAFIAGSFNRNSCPPLFTIFSMCKITPDRCLGRGTCKRFLGPRTQSCRVGCYPY